MILHVRFQICLILHTDGIGNHQLQSNFLFLMFHLQIFLKRKFAIYFKGLGVGKLLSTHIHTFNCALRVAQYQPLLSTTILSFMPNLHSGIPDK